MFVTVFNETKEIFNRALTRSESAKCRSYPQRCGSLSGEADLSSVC